MDRRWTSSCVFCFLSVMFLFRALDSIMILVALFVAGVLRKGSFTQPVNALNTPTVFGV